MGQLLFKKWFWEAIRSGTKRTTLRRWDRPRVRAGGRAYAPGVGWLRVDSVEEVELDALDEPDARADGFASLQQMLQALAALYPNAPRDGKRWFRVGFAFESSDGAAAKSPMLDVERKPATRKTTRRRKASRAKTQATAQRQERMATTSPARSKPGSASTPRRRKKAAAPRRRNA